MEEGWVAWPGPALADFMKQFVVHNRMLSGGFVIEGRLVTLADISCPVLFVVGEVDEIAPPRAVRPIVRAAPRADVYEVALRAGHFGLATTTWPTVARWARWDGNGDPPEGVHARRPIGRTAPRGSAPASASGSSSRRARGPASLAAWPRPRRAPSAPSASSRARRRASCPG
jgi:putative long chain acyl-CoA synthase